jgi:hypothetical protein
MKRFMVVVALVFTGCPGGDPASARRGVAATWENVSGASGVQRTRTPGGWLVARGSSGAMCYVPDPEHAWLAPTHEAPR